MSGSNKLESVDYRLKNLTNALYLTGTDDVAIRTGITGNINVAGDINIPGNVQVYSSPEDPVHTHITELGTYGNLKLFMPVQGTVSVNNFPTSTTITSGNVSIFGNVEITNDVGNPIPISANTTVNGPNNRIYVSQQTDVVLADSTYYMNVARGLISGTQSIHRAAYNPDCAKDTEESIWYEGGLYPWNSWTSAGYLYMICTNALDTGQTMFVEGLDASYNYQSETITTNGVTAVRTNLQYLRLRKVTMTSNGSSNANTGDITFRLTSGTGTVVAHIGPGFGETKIAAFTVPAGKTAYLMNIDGSSFNSGAGAIGTQIRMYRRPFNQVFTVLHVGEAVNGLYHYDFIVPVVITEKTDIDLRAVATGNGTIVAANFDIILIDN